MSQSQQAVGDETPHQAHEQAILFESEEKNSIEKAGAEPVSWMDPDGWFISCKLPNSTVQVRSF